MIYLFILLLGCIACYTFLIKKDGPEPSSTDTEAFIQRWLTNENGTLATNILDSEKLDEDLVKGREALSETLGLWLEYALLKDDKALFFNSYTLFNRYFLESDGFVHWKLTETGRSEVSTNALVDDLRIIRTLIQASERWNMLEYKNAAAVISAYIVEYNRYQHVLTDYYDRHHDYAREIITLSYIEPNALREMKRLQLIDSDIYANMMGILEAAPSEGPFFPKSYHVKKKKYLYDDSINMIDQGLVALYRAQSGYSTEAFLKFIRKEFAENGRIYGQYNRVTWRPSVNYESPAIYGWLVLYCLEINEYKLAESLHKKMLRFRAENSEYKGGFGVYQDDTHIFDNLVPMLAEKKWQVAVPVHCDPKSRQYKFGFNGRTQF